MYQLYVYVPSDKKEGLKEALFSIGVGRIGNYSHCCFEYSGQGQFKALKGASPSLGEIDKVEHVPETKIEFVLEKQLIPEAIKTLKQAHPYEEPAYGVIQLLEI